MFRLLKLPVIIIAAITLTSLSIDAVDTLSGSGDTLLAELIASRSDGGRCPEGMSEVKDASGSFCIDIYERSVGAECPVLAPASLDDTARNLSTQSCLSVSKKDALPWVNVAFHQAKELCAKAGGRLPSHDEWYRAALGTTPSSCNINSTAVAATGARDACRAMSDAMDMVGNAWEWIDGGVENNTYNNRALPQEGYVAGADVSGVALETSSSPSEAFGRDYFWADPQGSYVMMRGGFYGSGEDAGLYAVHARVESAFSGNAISFRCVQ